MKIALGTVQFGLEYGIANQKGQVFEYEAKKIIEYAKEHNIDTIDTAIGYGDSEQCLGGIGVKNWDIITKIPEIPQNCKDINSWIDDQFMESLNRLKVNNVKGLMLHQPMQLVDSIGQEIWLKMKDLKKNNLVDKIGFSIYDPEELDKLYDDFHPDIIQAPFNIFDQRLETSGWLEKLHNSGVEVHIRSVFLQGLLLISAKDRPIEFKRWAYLWKILDKWLAEEGLTPLEACIGFANANEYISHIVVGVDSKSQLKQILEASDKVLDFFPSSIITTDQSLINPSNWTDL
jgi:aryl-alcohol dehydrogenase-like predicted oxidoreductase